MSREDRYVERQGLLQLGVDPNSPFIYCNCNNHNSDIELTEELFSTASILAKIRDEIKQQYTGCGLINDGLDIAIDIVETYLKELNDDSD